MLRRSALAAPLLLTLGGCSRTTPLEAGESRLDMVVARDKLIVGVYSTSPPMAYVDEKGELVGMEIDIARGIARDLLGDATKVEFVVLPSEGRFPAVLSGKVDFGICSTTVTGPRAVRVAFTRGYMDTGGTVVARKDAGISRLLELNDPSHTYAVLNVPASIERAKAVLPKANLAILDTPSAMFLATKSGRATAFPIDQPIAEFYTRENADLMLLDTTGTALAYVSNNAIFLKPGDFRWWLFLDTWVSELRFGSRYDQYVQMFRTWLRREPPPQRFYDHRKF